jgi:hypothetical protein
VNLPLEPSDLMPAKYEAVINLKTAKASVHQINNLMVGTQSFWATLPSV